MNIYDTDVTNLTCNCEDWKQTRNTYSKDDPRRLCKHLINKMNVSSLTNSLKYFIEDIEFYKTKEWGFKQDFEKILTFPINNFKVLIDVGWMNVYDSDGNKYGYLNDSYTGEHWWAKKNKPIGFEEVESFFKKRFNAIPLPLQGKEKSDVIKYIKEVIPSKKNTRLSIEDDQYEPSPDGIYYCLYESANDYVSEDEVRHIIVKNNEIIIEMYYGKLFQYNRDYEYAKSFIEDMREKEQERLNNEKREYEEELSKKRDKAKDKGYLWEIKDTLYREAITFCNRDHEAQYTKYIEATNKVSDEYSNAKKLLKSSKSDITSILFHKILNNLKMIKKVRTLNLNEWIIINDGLKYGINIEKDSKYFSEIIPDWYKITTINAKTLELVEQRNRQNVRMTKALWKNSQFEELLELVIKHIENQNREKKPVERTSSKQAEREKWLINVSCHNCSSKNIHKKDKRQRKNFQVQRYQCMDCKSIFQERIDEISSEVKNTESPNDMIKNPIENLDINNNNDIKPSVSIFKKIINFFSSDKRKNNEKFK